VEASNLYSRTLIFSFFYFIVLLSKTFHPFLLSRLSVLLSFFRFTFLSPFVFSLLFHPCFVPIFLAHVISSLAYRNLLGTERIGCCCCRLMGRWTRSTVHRFIKPGSTRAVDLQIYGLDLIWRKGMRRSNLHHPPTNE
jgi:hypothetical protein